MKKRQPQVKVIPTVWDYTIDALGILVLAFMWYYVLSKYMSLPDEIPVHFNGRGEVNRMGSKSTIFAMPIIATFLFLALWGLAKIPHSFNYTMTITPENAERVYSRSATMMRIINLLTLLLMCYVIYTMIVGHLGYFWLSMIIYMTCVVGLSIWSQRTE